MWRSSAVSKRHDKTPATLTPPTRTEPAQNDASSTTQSRTLNPGRKSTLSEALKGKPFKNASREDIRRMPSSTVADNPVDALNDDLRTFANVYPDVKLEVLRELLVRFDGESRLQICIEQLFRYKGEWARGRLLNPPRDLDEAIPTKDLFRHQEYIEACKRTLCAEFRALSKSTVDAVLAEVNHSYKRSRPVLQDLAARTWRATITNLFKKKRTSEEPATFLVERGRDGERHLQSTGNDELNAELEALFFTSVRQRENAARNEGDLKLARTMNQLEAEEAEALFECQCCYGEVPFEDITTCSSEGHTICVECVQRTLHEALFGQNWTKSVDMSRSTLRCVAQSSTGECEGHIPYRLLLRSVISAAAGNETWLKFEQRLVTENLAKSHLLLVFCPFCCYAEAQQTHTQQSASRIRWRLRIPRPTFTLTTILALIVMELLLPTIIFLVIFAFLISPSHSKRLWYNAVVKLSSGQHTLIFMCRNPTCLKKSCIKCHKQWHNPHTCHEPLILSLRTTVEAARTAALKRTCPRCGTSFVKSSGCNKLVCPCGYAMCYICRKNIGKVSARVMQQNAVVMANGVEGEQQQPQHLQQEQAGAQAGIPGRQRLRPLYQIGAFGGGNAAIIDEELVAAGEGYRHFCPHFRPNPGQKCTECDKCDLYKNENEDAVVQKAGEQAERRWREKYVADNNNQENSPDSNVRDKIDVKGLEKALVGLNHDFNHRSGSNITNNNVITTLAKYISKACQDIHDGNFDVLLQSCVDWAVERCIIIIDGDDGDHGDDQGIQ